MKMENTRTLHSNMVVKLSDDLDTISMNNFTISQDTYYYTSVDKAEPKNLYSHKGNH